MLTGHEVSLSYYSRMFLDIRNSFLLIAESIGWRLSTQSFDQMLCTLWNLLWHLNDIDAAED